MVRVQIVPIAPISQQLPPSHFRRGSCLEIGRHLPINAAKCNSTIPLHTKVLHTKKMPAQLETEFSLGRVSIIRKELSQDQNVSPPPAPERKHAMSQLLIPAHTRSTIEHLPTPPLLISGSRQCRPFSFPASTPDPPPGRVRVLARPSFETR